MDHCQLTNVNLSFELSCFQLSCSTLTSIPWCAQDHKRSLMLAAIKFRWPFPLLGGRLWSQMIADPCWKFWHERTFHPPSRKRACSSKELGPAIVKKKDIFLVSYPRPSSDVTGKLWRVSLQSPNHWMLPYSGKTHRIFERHKVSNNEALRSWLSRSGHYWQATGHIEKRLQ